MSSNWSSCGSGLPSVRGPETASALSRRSSGLKPTNYHGYKSYQYLTPGRDYKEYELCAEVDRVPSAPVAVSESEARRVDELLARGPIISLHDHPSVMPLRIESELFDYRRHGRDFTGFEGLSRSGLDLVIDNLGDGEGLITSLNGWKWDETVYDIGMRLCDLAHQDFVRVVRNLSDLELARGAGQVGLTVGLESAAPIENELDRLDILYGLGVRAIGLTYNSANHVGSGLGEAVDGGLTAFGRRAVERMNQLGILIDLAHVGDRTSLDAIRESKAPVCISHAGARALWPTQRLKPDQVLLALADRGGLIGIEAAPNTTITRTRRRHSLDSIMEHFEYCVQLMGIDHVAFGPDTTFGDHVGFHKAVVNWFGPLPIATSEHFEPVEWVDGIESPAESFPNIVRWLVSHGYSDDDISKAVGGNVLRLLQVTWDNPTGR